MFQKFSVILQRFLRKWGSKTNWTTLNHIEQF